MRALPRLAGWLMCGALVAVTAPVEAEEPDVFARVTVAEAELRSGPGTSHRVVHRAARGEAFLVRSRAGLGFWLEVELNDGRRAFVLGDTVERVAVGEGEEGASRAGFFAPPALREANAGFALLGGVFDLDGYVELKPAWVLAPAVSFEPYVGLSLQPDARRFVYGLSGMLNLAPDWALAPYVSVGGGGVRQQPNASNDFVREVTDLYHVRAGGGLLVSLRWRVSLRLEATNTVLFTEDSYSNVQTYTGGLGTYF